jgi:hypothetical protein
VETRWAGAWWYSYLSRVPRLPGQSTGQAPLGPTPVGPPLASRPFVSKSPTLTDQRGRSFTQLAQDTNSHKDPHLCRATLFSSGHYFEPSPEPLSPGATPEPSSSRHISTNVTIFSTAFAPVSILAHAVFHDSVFGETVTSPASRSIHEPGVQPRSRCRTSPRSRISAIDPQRVEICAPFSASTSLTKTCSRRSAFGVVQEPTSIWAHWWRRTRNIRLCLHLLQPDLISHFRPVTPPIGLVITDSAFSCAIRKSRSLAGQSVVASRIVTRENFSVPIGSSPRQK